MRWSVTHIVSCFRMPLQGALCVGLGRRLSMAVVVVLALAGFGCTTVDLTPTEADTSEATVSATSPDPTAEKSPNGMAGRPLVVVVDDPRNAHLEMLQVFSARLARPYRILNLAHRSRESVAATLRSLAPIEVVVVGPAAYEVAATIPGLDVFYAGVLDPGRTTQGVDALPPFDVQLDYWQSLAPDVRRLGVIGGSGMASRVEDLARACEDRGLSLEQRQVSSDTETLLAFRSMVPRIDGFVFLPDESVLSPRVIQQVMSHGRRNEVQILVYSPVMFNLGASLYVQSDPVRVASALIELLSDPDSRPQVAEIRIRTRLRGPLELSAVEPDVVKAGF